jgi:hypothetical protein
MTLAEGRVRVFWMYVRCSSCEGNPHGLAAQFWKTWAWESMITGFSGPRLTQRASRRT